MILKVPIAITACQVFSPYGIGNERLWKGSISGETALKSSSKVAPYESYVGALDFQEYSLERIMQKLLNQSLVQAGLADLDQAHKRFLIIVITRTGPLSDSLTNFSWLKPKDNFWSPVLSSYSVTVSHISAACASVMYAIYEACSMLESDLFDAALLIGGDFLHLPEYLGLRSARVLSSTKAQPFGKNRDGISIGEGGGVLVLQRQKEIQATPLGYVKGISKIIEHIHSAQVHPSSVLKSMQTATADSKIISYVHAHATGTIAGDSAEAAAIHEYFPHNMYVTSHKGSTGHLLYNSGFISIALSLTSMEKQIIPPTLVGEEIDKDLSIKVVSTFIENSCKEILINAAGFSGNYSSLWLSHAGF